MNKDVLKDESAASSILSKSFIVINTDLKSEQVVKFLADTIQPQESSEIMKVISLIGGVASGKSQLARALVEELKARGLASDSISSDDFSLYTRQERWQKAKDGASGMDLHDGNLMDEKTEAIKNITGDETVSVPWYDPKTGDAVVVGEANFPHKIGKLDVLIAEGDFNLVKNPDLLVYIEMPTHLRRETRIQRDIKERDEVGGEKITAETIGASFDARQKSQHLQFTEPVLSQANIVLTVDPTDKEWTYDIYRAKLSV